MRIAAVVAYDDNNVIGKDGKLPWNLTEDIKWFRDVTMGHIVAMGRKTFESIGKPLEGRTNIVISKTLEAHDSEVIVVRDIMDAALYAAVREEDLYIIGGESVYEQSMEYVDKLYISHVKGTYDGDSKFPDIDLKNGWYRISRKKLETHESCIYIKHNSPGDRTLTLSTGQ
jgi:dihydrofolate reductase